MIIKSMIDLDCRTVLSLLADGYNVHYGARSIKHEVSKQYIVHIYTHAGFTSQVQIYILFNNKGKLIDKKVS